MMSSLFLAAAQQQAPAARPVPQGNLMTMLLPFVLVFVIFYVLIILPQRKKQKKHMEMIENLKPGDRIITSGGIYATVMGVQKEYIEVKISASTNIKVTKGSIGVILGKGDAASEKPES